MADSFFAGSSRLLPAGALVGVRLGVAVGVLEGVIDQAWFDVPVHDQIWRAVPSFVLLPVTSRHLPEPAPTSAPPLKLHCCAAVPLQS
jgi:hypothetical protein